MKKDFKDYINKELDCFITTHEFDGTKDDVMMFARVLIINQCLLQEPNPNMVDIIYK